MNDGDSGKALLYNPHVFVCMAEADVSPGRTCCGAKGAVELMAHMRMHAKGKGVTGIRINRADCLQRCELGPVMVLHPEGVWYAYRTKEDVEEIVETHIIGGGRVERLLVDPDAKTLADLKTA